MPVVCMIEGVVMERRFILFILSLLSAFMAEARIVSGGVYCGNTKLSDVIVSDGENFTVTQKDGSYSLDVSEDADFVFIVTPSGYAADWSSGVPQFYKRILEGDMNFDLKKFDVGRQYNIIAVADPQPRTEEHFMRFAGAPLEDVEATVSALEGQSVGIVLGDICFDSYHLMQSWKDEIVRVGIPFYPVVGNHDHNMAFQNESDAIKTYRSHFGPENYAFFIGKDLVVVLDNIIYGGHISYKEGYTDEVLDWLRKLMTYIPADTDVYVAQHSPLSGRYGSRMIVNHEKLLEILEGHDVVFLSGHNHTNTVFTYADGVMEHNVASICGTHWDTRHCIDGTPAGYKVLTKRKGKLSWYYKSVGEHKDVQCEIYAPGLARLNPKSVVVKVWDYDPLWKVEWWQDGEYKGEMKPVEEYSPIQLEELMKKYEGTGKEPADYRRTKKSGNYFAATPSTDAGVVRVCVTDRFGRIYQEEVSVSPLLNAVWDVVDLGRGALAMSTQVEIFGSAQCISLVKYPMKKFRTDILHRPGDTAGKTSDIGRETGASFAINGGYFHMKQRIPSVYFREGKVQLGQTHPTELYRIDGLLGFKDKKGRKVRIEQVSDTTMYGVVSKGWKEAMASGPMLIVDDEIVVPFLMGDKTDEANVVAMSQYSSAQFYDRRHPRTAFGTDDKGNAYLVVIDGRFKGMADGATIYETACICHMLGMTDSINLDGGGSTTLWTDETGVLNHPCDNRKFDHQGERAVPNLIVVY